MLSMKERINKQLFIRGIEIKEYFWIDTDWKLL